MSGIKLEELEQFIKQLREQHREMSDVMDSMRKHLLGMKESSRFDNLDFLTDPFVTQLNYFGTIETNFGNEATTLEQVKESYLAQDRKIANDISVSIENKK